LAGYGASGKTMAVQSLLLSIAAAQPIWGWFRPTIQGRVGHLDLEQGRHATFKRYQRLARGLGITIDDIGDRLRVAVHPSVYLTDPSAPDVYARECEGMAICVLDSLRGATPGIDENDSKIRAYLDLLARVSEKTGTAFMLIHHAGKPAVSKGDEEADLRMVLRGSSAIFDACGSVFAMIAERDGGAKPKRMIHTKPAAEAECGPIEPFYLAIEDVPIGTNPRAGVRLVYRTVEQVKPPSSGTKTTKIRELAERALEYIRRVNASGRGVPGKKSVVQNVEGRDAELYEAVQLLLDDGRIEDRPTRGSDGKPHPRFWATACPDSVDEEEGKL